MSYRVTLLALSFPLVVGCLGSVAPSPDSEPSPPAVAVVDAGSEADAPDPCAERPVEAWCSLVAKGGTNVDPRADRCCTRWIDGALEK